MMKIATVLIAAFLIAPTAGAAFALSEHPAHGVVAPYVAGFLPNAEAASAPAPRTNGSAGQQANPFGGSNQYNGA